MLDSSKRNDLPAFCQALIQRKSVSGDEREIADDLKHYCLDAGFDSAEIDCYGNIAARIKGNRPGKCILFDGRQPIGIVCAKNPSKPSRLQVLLSFDGVNFCSGNEKTVGNTGVFARAFRQHGRKFARQNRQGS